MSLHVLFLTLNVFRYTPLTQEESTTPVKVKERSISWNYCSMEAYNVWGDWDIYIVLQYEIVWSVIPTLQTRIHTYLFSPQTVSCYPQSLGEDETSLKGQELHETAQKSFLKAAFEVEVEVSVKPARPYTHTAFKEKRLHMRKASAQTQTIRAQQSRLPHNSS